MSGLDVRRAALLDTRTAAQQWLIEGLWAESAVGIVGGEPKCCKSFLALDMAVSVAAGVPCLGRYPVRRRGPVLLYAAEDAPHIVRARLGGICASAQVPLDSLDVHVIVDPVVRIDVDTDRSRLRDEVLRLRPRLLVLDPFVRLHRIDENAAAEVAPLLAYLRALQRELGCAVVLVHHARKGGHARAGQALRGSSELHAWGDSNLYLRRDREQLLLSIEHRAAAGVTSRTSRWSPNRNAKCGAAAVRAARARGGVGAVGGDGAEGGRRSPRVYPSPYRSQPSTPSARSTCRPTST